MVRHKGVWSVESSVHECKQQTPTLSALPTLLPPEEMVPGKTLACIEKLCSSLQHPIVFVRHSYYKNKGEHSFYRQCVLWKIGCFVKSVSFWNIGQKPLIFFSLRAQWCVLSGLHVLKWSEPVVRLRQRWAELNDQFWVRRDIKVV